MNFPSSNQTIQAARRDWALWVVECLALAAVCYGCGRLALLLAIPPGYATAVWPAAGVALAVVLLRGYRILPGVALGSFLLTFGSFWNSSSGHSLTYCMLVSTGIAAGAALEPALGSFLIRRTVGFPTPLMREREVVAFLALGGPVAGTVGASCGTAALLAAHVISRGSILFTWCDWWVADTAGVLIVCPLVLAFFGTPREAWARRRVAVGIPLCVTFALTMGLFVFTVLRDRDQQRAQFEHKADTLNQAFQRTLNSELNALYALQAFFAVTPDVDREQFKQFAAVPLARHPQLQVMAWLPEVENADRHRWEREFLNQPATGRGIFQLGSDNRPVRASERAEYFPIGFIEPQPQRAPMLGFDAMSEPSRGATMQRARDTGMPAASTPFVQVLDPHGPLGVIISMPVYKHGLPHATLEQRRANIKGFVNAGFQPAALVTDTLTAIDPQGVTLSLIDQDIPGPGKVMYPPKALVPNSARDPAALSQAFDVQIGGRRWTLLAACSSEYQLAHPSGNAWAVLGAGLLFTSLLGGFLLVLTGRTSLIEVEVAQRTATINLMSRNLQAANDAKTLFLANLSHEIRTPLTAIIGYADLLLNPAKNNPDLNESMQIIRRNARHLLALINDILDLSTIEAGHLQLQIEPVDLGSAVLEVRQMMQPQTAAKGLDFSIHCDGTIPRLIQTDALRLRQILVNLVANAVKFTESGWVRIVLSASLLEHGPERKQFEIRFDVADSGIGLTPAQIGSLFRTFSQVDASATRRYGGTGLGLAISQRLAVLLGGSIDVQSEPGAGSTFSLAIRAGTAPDVAMVSQLDSAESIASGSVKIHPPVELCGRILLAEDGRDNARFMRAVMSDAGLAVSVVDNGLEAVEAAATGDFDLILMDIQMPVLDGYAAAAEIRARGNAVPILAITANVFEPDDRRGSTAGITARLNKPIEPAELLAAVRRHLPAKPTGSTFHRSKLAGTPRWEKLLNEYIAELPGDVAALSQLLADNKSEELAAMLHQIKGSAENYGFPEITRLARIAEAVALGGGALDAGPSVHQLLQYLQRVEGYDALQPNAPVAAASLR